MKLPSRPAANAQRTQRRDEVHEAQPIDAVAARGEDHRQHYAKQPAVERHAALPDIEDLERVRCVVAGLVEQHVAQASAEDHAEHDEEQQIVELRAGDRRLAFGNSAHAEPPARREAGEVHEAVPAHGQRADRERDRVDVRMDQHQGPSGARRASARKSRAAVPRPPRGQASHRSSRGWRSAISRYTTPRLPRLAMRRRARWLPPARSTQDSRPSASGSPPGRR